MADHAFQKVFGTLSRAYKKARSSVIYVPFYPWTLKGEMPKILSQVPPAPWAGIPELGQDILHGQFRYYDQVKSIPSAWQSTTESPDFYNYLHSFTWAYHLREVGGSGARRLCRALIEGWLDLYATFDRKSWQLTPLSNRLINLVSLYEFYGVSAGDEFREKLHKSMGAQTLHLQRLIRWEQDPEQKLLAQITLCLMLLVQDHPQFETPMEDLEESLQDLVSSEGFLPSQDPRRLLKCFVHLFLLRALLNTLKKPLSSQLQGALYRLANGLRILSLSPGKLIGVTLDPFEKNLLTQTLSKMPGKFKTPFWAKKDGVYRHTFGKTLLHHFSKNRFEVALTLGQTPFFTSDVLFDAPTPADPDTSLIPETTQDHVVLKGLWQEELKGGNFTHNRHFFFQSSTHEIRCHDVFSGPVGQTVTLAFTFDPSVIKIQPMENKKGFLLTSAKHGNWLLKTQGMASIETTAHRRKTITGGVWPYWKLNLTLPLVPDGQHLKWILKLIK